MEVEEYFGESPGERVCSGSGCPAAQPALAARGVEKRVPMTRLRKRVAERLLEAKNSTAMLTTFNEVNMKPIMDLHSAVRWKRLKNATASVWALCPST